MFCEGAGCVACNPKGDDPCDGYDNDCDGIIDDGPKSDHDGDGYTYCGKVSATTGLPIDIDCNDNDKTISPAGKEICNGKDDNCDGIIDNANLVCAPGETCVPTTGKCISNTQTCTVANCPSPKVCDPTTQQCVLPDSADAGSSCTSSEQCQSGICAGTTELGSAATTQQCTEACCTSDTCPTGQVCYGAGMGGNYCVDPTLVGRTTVGAGEPGAACQRGPDCRSGVCTSSKCEDTCCSDANCTNGTNCAATTFGSNPTLACIPPPGTGAANATCTQNSDCISGYCAGYTGTNAFGETENVFACAQPCCGSKSCGQLEDNQLVCYDDFYPPPQPGGASPTSGPVVPVCDEPQEGTGHDGETPPTGQVGDTCTKTTDCYSNRCLIFTSGQFCSDVCCVDSDCQATAPTWVCRPTADGPGTYLRCVPPGG